jgi:hypothetical protein
VNLTDPVGLVVADGQGQGTITDDDTPPSVSVSDVSVVEGNAGTVNGVFTLTLSQGFHSAVTVNVATANESALAGADYTALTQAVEFTAGATTRTVSVAVNGDTSDELLETFLLQVTGTTGGVSVSDGTGVGRILDDDGRTLADTNSDGLADVLTRDGDTGEVRVLASTSQAFTSTSWATGYTDSRDVYLADVDGDGRSDLVFRDRTNGDVKASLSLGTSFGAPLGTWSYGWSTSYELLFADTTGDGKADLIGRHLGTGDVYVFPSTGTGFSSSAPAGLWSYGWTGGYDLFVADVTGDGKGDLVSRYFGPSAGLTGDVYVAISTGTGFTFNGRWTYGFSAGYNLYLGDMDGDGKADLLTRYYGTGAVPTGDVNVIYSSGTGFDWRGNFGRWTYGWGSTYEIVVRDVDGDGRADFVGRHTGTGDVVVARSTGTSLSFLGTWADGVTTVWQTR